MRSRWQVCKPLSLSRSLSLSLSLSPSLSPRTHTICVFSHMSEECRAEEENVTHTHTHTHIHLTNLDGAEVHILIVEMGTLCQTRKMAFREGQPAGDTHTHTITHTH